MFSRKLRVPHYGSPKDGRRKKVEQIKAEGFPDEWKSWGEGFVNSDRWIDTIYRSFSVRGNPTKP